MEGIGREYPIPRRRACNVHERVRSLKGVLMNTLIVVGQPPQAMSRHEVAFNEEY